jgi:hypothetical protein
LGIKHLSVSSGIEAMHLMHHLAIKHPGVSSGIHNMHVSGGIRHLGVSSCIKAMHLVHHLAIKHRGVSSGIYDSFIWHREHPLQLASGASGIWESFGLSWASRKWRKPP